MTSSAKPLVIDNLSFRYRDRQGAAVHNISFEAEPGEILLIAGASGCGKTTLVRAINGLIPRSYKGEISGQVLLFGKDTKDWKLSQISQKIGTVLQDPERQILGTKVLNEVAFGLENLGMARDEIFMRVDEALNFLKISHLRDRETFNLSGGEKQKVALAGVLAMRPSILLLDEPLASLDPASAQDTLDAVRALADDGMTVLLVEHRVEDVLRIAPERVMFMGEGEIRYLGDVQGLSKVVNYREVKLPAEQIVGRARQDPPPVEIQVLPGATGKSAEKEALVKFQDVAFGYDVEREVLHGINLEINRGDVIAVLGPNGAGKTTFVKHAIGLLKPKSGSVLVNGRDTREASVAEIASMLGYVFQSPSHMLFAPTVREELSFGPTNMKHPRQQIEMEVKEALKIVNLSDKENDPPLALSFGQQKRVSIAAILAMLTFLTGRGGSEVYKEEHLIREFRASFSILDWTPVLKVTVERAFFAVSQLVRVTSIAVMTILIPYSLNPALYGITFKGIGLPDKFAYAMDLTMRFIPTFGRDFQLTMDAQRARGYELDKISGGIIQQVRKLGPVIVPVTIHAIIGSEDIIDAMDLRAFGVGPRTWTDVLTYQFRDRALIAFGVLILSASIVVGFMGYGAFWVPEALTMMFS